MQVAFGLLQFLSSVGGGSDAAAGGVNAPIGLNSLLSQYQLPPNPLKAVMHARMEREPQMFERRPLEAQVLQYAGGPPCRVEESRVAQQSHWQLRCRPACRTALRLLLTICCCNALPRLTRLLAVADVWQLLPARAGLEADLGPAAAARVEALSAAYSEWCLDAADRTCAVGTGSYAAAVQLPVGEDLQMFIQPPSYRPRCACVACFWGGEVADGLHCTCVLARPADVCSLPVCE